MKKSYQEIGLVALVMILAIDICHAESEKPPARANHSAVYDSDKKQMIICGGWGQSGELYDTWAFNIEKKEWKEIEIETIEGPFSRVPRVIYDQVDRKIIMFEGNMAWEDIAALSSRSAVDTIQLYELEKAGDGPEGKWKMITAKNTPSALVNLCAIYDSLNNQIIVVGVSQFWEITADSGCIIWIYDIEKKKWKKVKAEGAPSLRYGYSAVYDSANRTMIIFGGGNGKIQLSDIWTFDIEKKKWEEIKIAGEPGGKKTPPARQGHSAIYDSVNNKMVIFGGEGQGDCFSDTWAFDIEKKEWEEIKVEKTPPAMSMHTAIYDSANKQMLVFGGCNEEQEFFSDIWVFDIEKKTWEEVKPK